MRRYTEWLKRLIREKRVSSILTYEHTWITFHNAPLFMKQSWFSVYHLDS